ncbi:hypothetical protein K437DRAFT_273259 [Tilletiaria anomala UBC 951]|uniref:DNA recombination and repair protein Rad51-like C-terminal domain-containing protein n=1 Tax=Tilletiaria anomala (strain ATCC 24038 / CBS 436.72 / UBC 951) TaxID=1037660 RepID=A0A066WFS8_TILAU|nr:uncharacterized protein K437DRAFT_273259 [Tilletiaria anomala UBC 951]KDN49610.1 hypothetical protein K437DRAFT_273259 [Tilletiaria anomala UBC 951]
MTSAAAASINAEGLLAEVQSQTGDAFLASILEDVDPFGPAYIASLDALFHTQDESHGLLTRFATTEIQGPPKSGKTSLLAFFIMTFLLPDSFNALFTRPALTSSSSSSSTSASVERKLLPIHLGGRGPGRAVLLFDNDGRFPLQKLRRMLDLHICNRIAEALRRTDIFDRAGSLPWKQPTKEEISAMIDSWLNLLHIWRPTSQVAFSAAVQHAPKTVDASPGVYDIGLIVVDSISAFHWTDIQKADHCSSSSLSGPPTHQAFASALRHLKHLQDASAAPVLLSNWAISEGEKAPAAVARASAGTSWAASATSKALQPGPLPGGRWWQEHLPSPPYPSFSISSSTPQLSPSLIIENHITLVPALPQPFPVGTTERAARTDGARLQALDRLQVTGWLRNRHRGFLGHFRFRVGDEALDVTV